MSHARAAGNDFDTIANDEAMETQRIQRGLTWRQVASQIWASPDAAIAPASMRCSFCGVVS